jgi:hypothetical protein
MLTLRNPLDVEPSNTTGVRKAALFASTPTPDAAPKPRPSRPATRPAPVVAAPVAPAPAARQYTVETIRAAKRSEEVVR